MVSSVSSNATLAYTTAVTSSATAKHKEMFAKLDTNSDGKVDTLELSAVVSKDSNGPDAATLMKQVDTNNDGSISESENDEFLTAMDDAQKSGASGAAGEASGTRPSGPPPGAGGGGAAESSESTTKVYDKLDTNKDGKVSMEELLAGMAKAASSSTDATSTDSTSTDAVSATGSTTEADAKELFKKIDANGDGSIDKTEFDAFAKRMQDAIKQQEQATASTYTAQGDVNYDAVGSTVNTIA